MSLDTGVRLLGGLAVAAFVLAVVWLVHDRNRLAALDAGHRDCVAAVAGDKAAKSSAGQACAPAIVAIFETATAARVCDAALPPSGVATTFAVKAVCSAPVKRLAADRDARAGEVENRDGQIARLKADQAGATARAAARARTQAQKEARSDVAIHAAPVGDDGLLVCAGECLRQLTDAEGGRP